MARFKLKVTSGEFGQAVFEAAEAYARSHTPDQGIEANIVKNMLNEPGVRVEFHYDGPVGTGGTEEYVIHIVVPDVTGYLADEGLNLTDFANDLMGTLAQRGCSR